MKRKEPITTIESDLMDWLPLDPEHAMPLHFLAEVMNTERIMIACIILSLKSKGVPVACIQKKDEYSVFIMANEKDKRWSTKK